MTRHKIPGLDAELLYDEEKRIFVVVGPDKELAEGLRVYHPTQYWCEVIHEGKCPSFPGWNGSIRGIDRPTAQRALRALHF